MPIVVPWTMCKVVEREQSTLRQTTVGADVIGNRLCVSVCGRAGRTNQAGAGWIVAAAGTDDYLPLLVCALAAHAIFLGFFLIRCDS